MSHILRLKLRTPTLGRFSQVCVLLGTHPDTVRVEQRVEIQEMTPGLARDILEALTHQPIPDDDDLGIRLAILALETWFGAVFRHINQADEHAAHYIKRTGMDLALAGSHGSVGSLVREVASMPPSDYHALLTMPLVDALFYLSMRSANHFVQNPEHYLN